MQSILLASAATVEDAPVIHQLAHEIWWAYYPQIIPEAQIRYMLEQNYSVDKLMRDIDQQVLKFFLFSYQQRPVGFTAYQLHQENHLFLDKVYLQVAYHRRGLGQQMLQSMEQIAREAGLSYLSLRVNKHNHQAIRAYQRAGLAIVDSICTDIGNGFVKNDFWMQKIVGNLD